MFMKMALFVDMNLKTEHGKIGSKKMGVFRVSELNMRKDNSMNKLFNLKPNTCLRIIGVGYVLHALVLTVLDMGVL